jgi:hypothetical protein
MSTLSVSNVSDGTTTVGTSYVVNGSAKAWVNFNGTGTAAIRDSFNHSSLTDHGTANYSNTLSSALGNANYVVTAMSQDTSVGDVIAFDSGTAPTTTAVKIYNFTTGSSVADNARICLSIQGDLA